MYSVTAGFLQAIRQSHTAVIACDAWRDGAVVASDLPVIGGSVTVDETTEARRQLTLTLLAEPGLWDTLAPVGTQLWPRRGIRYPSGVTEVVPLGRFPIDVQTMGYTVDGNLQLTAPDQWVTVQRARFLTPYVSSKGRTISLTARHQILGALGEAWPIELTATSTAKVGAVVWEKDRAKAVKELLDSIAAEAFMDVDGTVVIRDIPTGSAAPVWTVDAGKAGILSGATRTRSRQRTYSAVVVQSEAADGTPKLAPVTVRDNDPDSPTYYLGPFGLVPFFYSSEHFRTVLQMTNAGRARLAKVSGLEQQLSVNAGTVNPALDAGDVITVVLPAESRFIQRPVEQHIVESVTVPLTVTDQQTIRTRALGSTETDTA